MKAKQFLPSTPGGVTRLLRVRRARSREKEGLGWWLRLKQPRAYNFFAKDIREGLR